jgi:hypothetical protein
MLRMAGTFSIAAVYIGSHSVVEARVLKPESASEGTQRHAGSFAGAPALQASMKALPSHDFNR